MKGILDRDENQQRKDNSWLVVMVVNILIIGTACLYGIFTSGSSYSILQSVGGFLVMINSILLFLSFSYHKTYWKKCLLMAAFGLVLFIGILFIQFIIDINKLL